jgi:NADH-ubiquinone oxidoreductase chain 4
MFFFIIFTFIFSFFYINIVSWGGFYFINDSYIFNLIILISLLILILVLMREVNKVINILSQFLVLICIIFFFSSNLLSLFIFFELSIFPIILIILGYGSQIEKINSRYYLIFYASFCSFPFLFIYFYYDLSLHFVYFIKFLRWELTLFLTLGFIIKFPVYFLHLWLPKAHVEAPTSASILLAGLLLKLGTVGFFRIIKVLTFTHINFWYYLAFLGIVLSSFNCAFQSDSKSLAAYSSVTHIGFTLLCLILFSMESKVSSLILMLAHGFTSTLIFYFIGEFYHRRNTRILYYFNSFINLSILLTLFFTLTFISNAGVPPSLSFISEFLSILVLFNLNKFFIFVILFYFFFAFYYRIYFVTNFFMGKQLLELDLWKGFMSLFHLFLIFNIFWLSIII